jgi:hypothetical protein
VKATKYWWDVTTSEFFICSIFLVSKEEMVGFSEKCSFLKQLFKEQPIRLTFYVKAVSLRKAESIIKNKLESLRLSGLWPKNIIGWSNKRLEKLEKKLWNY